MTLVPETAPRVLFAYRDDVDLRGGAATVMHQTVAALEQLGVRTQVSVEVEPCVDGFDVVHPVNIWSPHSALQQMRHLHATGAPIAWQPFYLHWCEYAWASLCLQLVGAPNRTPEERAKLVEGMRSGAMEVNGLTRWLPNEVIPGLHAAIGEMAALADHICACSSREMQMLSQTCFVHAKPFTLTRHGVEASAFAAADPAPFRALVGDGDYVLCVGSIDTRKNQALLAHALAGTEHRLVLLGPCFEPETLRVVRELAGPRMTHIERVPREMVASALAGASAHALPSFAEGSALASMEAAAAGCPVVVSNRSSEFEYYGDLAVYCDPVDPGSIRRAVDEAVRRRREEPELLDELRRHVTTFTWEAAAEATLVAYRRAISAGRRRVRAACWMRDVRATAVLAHADELCGDPELLSAYGARVGAADEVTLVIATPPGAEPALEAAVTAAGLTGEGSPDMVAVADSELLPRAVDAVLTRRPLAGALAHLGAVDVTRAAAGV